MTRDMAIGSGAMMKTGTSLAGVPKATAVVLTLCVLCLMLGLASYSRVQSFFMSRANDEGVADLRLVSVTIEQLIGRYDPIPALIAGDPEFWELLKDPSRADMVPLINEKLRHLARDVGASDIYVMDRSGRTIAASNYREERSFIGERFDYRPYFLHAAAGEATRYHALGTTSGERGFFFSAPILDGLEVAGVLAVKIPVDPLEDLWRANDREIFVSDLNGVIFLSTDSSLLFRTLEPLTSGVRQRIEETRQFPLSVLESLSFSVTGGGEDPVEVLLGEPGEERRFLSDSASLVLPGWHATVLQPMRLIQTRTLFALATWGLVVLVLTLAMLTIIQWRARLAERMEHERSQRETLEVMVRERTADLDAANTSLRSEIEERKAAETRLRKTQAELVQAGKLAALGQMSAALSHEINQPLAGIKSYAENAAQYLERKRYDEVGTNISHISKMIDRVARISAHLRNFARRPGDQLSAIPVSEVIAESVELVRPHTRRNEAEIVFVRPDQEVWAIGGRLRLQQVMVNVLTNAIDAMRDQARRVVEITASDRGEYVEVRVRDTGTGLPENEEELIFEPFFTTKQVGSGMGLGLSISFNIIRDFGGSLSAANHPDGGAEFLVTLKKAYAPAGLVAE
ncbi:sensor histidine kinase [Amaricoccus tamworthensis]|uniref:sensor histidine kinase n=1 Tax=Amaricoccus tamworthensis TaxID=57002 RepID=UPI003C7CD29B